MTQPLYKLAEMKKLPKHQFMDVETLDWIKSGIPNGLRINDYLAERRFEKELNYLVDYIPKAAWYKNKSIFNGMHGFLHAYRVAAYLLILNSVFKLRLNKYVLCVAGLFHDIKRVDDRSDIGHSKRSAIWVKNNKKLIQKFIPSKKFTNNDWTNIISAIKFHDADLRENLKVKPSEENILYIDILKSADALDRYRLPKKKWWINNSYLKIKPSRAIKNFAFNLIIATEDLKIRLMSLGNQ